MAPVRCRDTGVYDMDFPPGRKIGPNSRRWTPEELVAWEQSRGIQMAPPAGMLDVRQVATRYGTSVPTVWRWRKGYAGRPPAREAPGDGS